MKSLRIMGMACLVTLTAGCATTGSSGGSSANAEPLISSDVALGALYQGKDRRDLYLIGHNYVDKVYPLEGEVYDKDPLGLTLKRVELVEALVEQAEQNAASKVRGKRYRVPVTYSTLDKPKKSIYHPEKKKLPKWADFWMVIPVKGLVRIPKEAGDLPLDFYVDLDVNRVSGGYYGPVKIVHAVRQSDFERALALWEAADDEAIRKLYHKDHELMVSFTLTQCSGNKWGMVICEHVPSDNRKRRLRPEMEYEKL